MLAVAAVVWLGSGCVQMARYRIDPNELSSLDGYDAKNERTTTVTVPTTYMVGKTPVAGTAQVPQLVTDKPYRLIHPSGRIFDFNSGTPMAFLTTGGATDLIRWRSISLGGGTLQAVPLKASELTLNVPMTDVKGAVFQVPSIGRGFLQGGLWTTGIGAAAGLVGLLLYSSNPNSFVVPLSLGVVGGTMVLSGLPIALLGLAYDRNSDADADDLKLGTLGSPSPKK